MRRLYLAQFGEEKTTEKLFSDAFSLLSLDSTPPLSLSDIYYIAPTPRKTREAIKVVTSLVQNTFQKVACLPPRFLTLQQLAEEINHASGEKIILPDFLKPVFLQSLDEERLPLNYYYHLGELIKDLKQGNLFADWEKTKNIIRENLDPFPNERTRIEKVFKLIVRYETELARRSFLDSEDILRAAATLVKEGKWPRKGKVLVLDGFMDLTPLEASLLSALLSVFDPVLALAYFDEGWEDLYPPPKEFVDFLLARGEWEIIKIRDETQNAKRKTQNAKFYQFSSREEEVEEICRQIKKRFAEKKLSLAETLVTFPNLNDYAPIVERVFQRYKIPFTLYPQRPLIASPVIIPVIALLRAVVDDYPRLQTAISLSSPFFTKIKVKTKELVNLYAKRVGLIKGEENWRRLGEEIRKEAKEKLEGKRRKPQSPPFLTQIERDINFFLSLTAPLKKKRDKLGNFVSDLLSILAALGWSAQENLQEKREFVSFLNQLNYLKEIELSTQEFLEVLETGLKYRPLPPEREEEGVRILGLLETRGLTAKQIFFGGLTEDRLPSPPPSDPFLPDWLRRKLGLLDREKHLSWQKLHFFRVGASSQNEPFLSYPRQEGDRVFLPSPFLTGEAKIVKTEGIFTEEEKDSLFGRRAGLSFSIKPIDFANDASVKRLLNRLFRSSLHVTKVEKLRRCPYLFYLEEVLKLSFPKETTFEIEAQEWGNLLHTVFEKLYADGPLPLAEVPKKLERILNAVLAQIPFHPFFKDCARRIFEKLLPDFLQEEKKLREEGFLPSRTEVKVSGEILPKLTIYGKIDRIDRREDSSYLILDYKTGGLDIMPNDIAKGSHLQLPLYAHLLRKEKLSILRLGIYSFKEKRVQWLAKNEEEVRAAEEKALRFAREAILMALNGRFPATPASEQVCFFCAYQFLCPK